MSKKKMCKYYSATKYGWLCGRADTSDKECPPHNNWRCEIVPRKAKPKMVKAHWSIITDSGGFASGISLDGQTIVHLHPGTVLNKENLPWFIDMLRKKCGKVEAKWLKGRKGL